MAQRVNIQERLKMRFLTVDYREKQETYGTCCSSADTGNIALDILNMHQFFIMLSYTNTVCQNSSNRHS